MPVAIMHGRDGVREVVVLDDTQQLRDVTPVPARCRRCPSTSVHFDSILAAGVAVRSWCCTQCGYRWPMHPQPPQSISVRSGADKYSVLTEAICISDGKKLTTAD